MAPRPLLLSLLAALAGCASDRGEIDYDLLFIEMRGIDYARILCRPTPMAERHTCMTSVIADYEANRDRPLTPDEVVNGPFVVVLGDQFYRGRYVSNPFVAAFTVSNGERVCRGRYDAFSGDTKPTFAVRCDDDTRGRAKLILDQRGSNGIGRLWLDDGEQGAIVFGHAAVGGPFG